MTHHLNKPPRAWAARPAFPSTRHHIDAEAPTQTGVARTSTAHAMTMMVALRYLEGRPSRPPKPLADANPLPALT